MKTKKATIKTERIEKALEKIKNAKTLEEFTLPKLPYKGSAGAFGTLSRNGEKITNITWDGCRDRFQNQSEPAHVMDFLFCHDAGTGKNVTDFILAVEELLMLNGATLTPEERLVIRPTSNPNVLHVKLSPFWKYRLRRSLLTALLRCGQYFKGRTVKDFERALFSQYYLQQTKSAVNAFMSGRTLSKLKKTAGFAGWWNLFSQTSEEGIRKFLARRKKEKKKEAAATVAPPVVEAKK